jgi:hypothetical protein
VVVLAGGTDAVTVTAGGEGIIDMVTVETEGGGIFEMEVE